MKRKALYFLIALICVTAAVYFFGRGNAITEQQQNPDAQALLAKLVNPGVGFLYSLEPRLVTDGSEQFHGYAVLGKIELVDTDLELVAAEFLGAERAHKASMPAMMCFKPRHGLRIINIGTASDFLLCYECNNMKGFEEGRTFEYGVSGSAVQLNHLLQIAKIPISKQ